MTKGSSLPGTSNCASITEPSGSVLQRLRDEAIEGLSIAIVEDKAAAGKFEIGRVRILAAGGEQKSQRKES